MVGGVCYKQSTEYVLRISDWRSYVCSSDLSRCSGSRSAWAWRCTGPGSGAPFPESHWSAGPRRAGGMGHNPPLPAVARNHAMPKKKIAARLSPIHGNGVFATEALEKGERIVRYKDTLRTQAEEDEAYGEDDENAKTFMFSRNDDNVIESTDDANKARK